MWEMVCYGLIGLSVLFLWITAISGTRYYEISMQLRDIKFLKFLIHISILTTIAALAYLIMTGNQIDV
jgi:hypothetical protein